VLIYQYQAEEFESLYSQRKEIDFTEGREIFQEVDESGRSLLDIFGLDGKSPEGYTDTIPYSLSKIDNATENADLLE